MIGLGDLVELNSGGPPMLVVDVYAAENGGEFIAHVEVEWMRGGEVSSDIFPAVCCRVVERAKP